MIPNDVKIQGGLAVEWGIINGEMGHKFKDTSFTFILNYVFVYEKTQEGNWMISRDIYNDNE